MKKNGKNIVTDQDITITNNNDSGRDLSSVLANYGEKINTLESNIKWIYKNGGIGTGSGGGSGSSSTSWKIVVTKGGPSGDVLTNNVPVNLSGVGNYTFCIQIYGGGQSSFRVSSSYVNSKGTQASSNVITAGDGFLWQKAMYLDLNGNISLTVVNQDTQEVSTFVIPYIVVSHTFTLKYVYADSKMDFTPSNNTIFMNDVKTSGIQAALTYTVSVGLLSAEYSYSDWEGNYWKVSQLNGITKTTPQGVTTTIVPAGEVPTDKLIQEKSTNTIYLDLCTETDILDFLDDNENAKYTQFILNVNITLEGNPHPEDIAEMSLKDNLIPAGMFLKLTTSAGTLYEHRQLNGDNVINYPVNGRFSLGSAVFVLTPYYGSLDTTRKYNLLIQLGTSPEDLEDVEQSITQLSDQTQQAPSVPITSSGEHYISFTISAEGTSYTTGYYFFVKESTSNFDWIPKDITPVLSSYYRRYSESNNVSIPYTSAISSNINNTENIVCTFDQQVASTYNDLDQLLTVGIQYSSINETEYPIFSFSAAGGTNKWNIFVYQSKIVISTADDITINEDGKIIGIEGESCEIFLPMTDNLDDSVSTNYHQLSIYKKFERREGNNYWKGVYVYLDGVLEAAMKNFVTVHQEYTDVVFYPGNYYVNEVEYHCFQHSDQSSSTTWLTDNDFIGYYYTYYEKLLGGAVDDSDKALFDAFSGFTCDSDNFVKTNSTAIDNIAKLSKIPVMVLSFTDTAGRINDTYNGYNVDNFRGWVSAEYTEMDEIENVSVTVQWADGKGTELTTITKQGSSAPANFELTLQGSSTRSYRCKNFELIAPESNDESKCLFSPNFDPNNPETFLPEESFTLKADVVDSSHTNNNAMGKFINDITTPFALARQNKAVYGNFIKNCLTGFPILLFIHTRYKQDKNAADVNIENYYFFGVYNFNLGRNSYFNLGYKDLTKLESLGLTSGFHIYDIAPEDNGILNSVAAAEIQGNNKFFDFSQYSETILYDIGTGDETVMFGDFVDGVSGSSGKYANAKSKIAAFVRRVARAGGYAFEAIGKTFSTSPLDYYGYNDKYSATDENGVPKNQVPNYLYQATRSKVGTTNIYNFTMLQDPATERDLKELLLHDETGESNVEVGLDYTAVCEYYTICMAFGLVDSVQKNLNIKSWNSGTSFYPAFYDMDTCLGVSNSGSRISYFAFSDYWESSVNDKGFLNEANVWRDYSPKEESDTTNGQVEENKDGDPNSAFFDVPSSYLFAIAKYAYPILKEVDLIMHPSNLWALWRNSSRNDAWNTQSEKQRGCLSNAEYFMNTYYNDHLKDVPLSAFNYNYKYKYFVFPENSTAFDTTNFPKFYGRKQAYTADWLQGRFHILDAYFNLNRLGDTLNALEDISSPIPDTQFIDSNNKDIYVLKDIFSDTSAGNQYINLSAAVSVQAKPYAPLILKGTNQSARYILPYDGRVCNLSIKTDSNQFSLLGGSSLWTYLSSINPFITTKGTLTVKSDYFTSLIGTSGICSLWTINTPSLKTISLTNNDGYSGDLAFESTGTTDNFPNLKTINITGTKIALRVSNESFTTLAATNMKAGSKIDITNVGTLSKVSISGTLSSLNIPSWQNNIILPTTWSSNNTSANWACNSVTVVNDTKKYPHNTLTIRNNTTMTSLSVTGFENVYVYNCPKLETFSINDPNSDVLKVLKIEAPSPSNATATTLKSGPVAGVVDLSNQTALTSVYLMNTRLEVLKLPNKNVDFPYRAFYGCSRLKYIEGSGNYYIISNDTFTNCSEWTYRQCEDVPGEDPVFARVFVKNTCTNLNNTFYITNTNIKGSIDYLAAKYFLDECIKSSNNPTISAGNVTTASNLFRNQSITYSLAQGWEEYLNGESSLSLSGFSKINTCNGILYDNPIDFMNKYMFQGFASQSTWLSFSDTAMVGERTANNPRTSEETRGMWRQFSNTWYHVLYTTIDVLEFISSKITQIRFRTRNSDDTCLYFIEYDAGITDTVTEVEDYSPLSEVSMHDLFYGGGSNPPRVMRILRGIEIYPEQIINCTNWFTTDYVSIQPGTGIDYGLDMDEVFERVTYSGVKGMENLFYNVEVKSIVKSFRNISLNPNTNNGKGRVDIATFLNWGIGETNQNVIRRKLEKLKMLFSQTVDTSIGFPKTITYADFQALWANVLKYAVNLTGLYRLFYNCIITGTLPSEFSLVDEGTYTGEQNTSITTIDYLFSNCYFRTDLQSQNQYLTITHDFFKYLPNLTSLYETFYSTRWKNPIPFDFLRKRREVVSTVFVSTGGSGRKPVKLITYEYDRTVESLEGCFRNIILETPQCFDPQGEYNKGSFKRVRLVTYGTGGAEIDEGTEYYESETSSTKHTIQQPTEITDTENIQSHFTQRITTYPLGTTAQEVKNLSNYSNVRSNGCFVAPDIFYGSSTSGCSIYACFANYNGSIVTFTGVLPDNLLKNCKSASITYTFYGLYITPKLYDTYIESTVDGNGDPVQVYHKYYYYVPVNFTDATSLANAFNFKLIVPPVSDYEKVYYVVFLNDSTRKSIPTSTITLANALPGGSNSAGGAEVPIGLVDASAGFPKYYTADSGIRYSVMGTPILSPIYEDDGQGNQVDTGETEFTGMEWGLDLMSYPNLKLDNIYNNAINLFIYGNVIKEGTLISWNKSTLLSNSSSYFMRIGYSDYGGLSYAAKIAPPLTSNSQYLIATAGDPLGNGINTESLLGYDEADYNTYRACYDNVTFYPVPT